MAYINKVSIKHYSNEIKSKDIIAELKDLVSDKYEYNISFKRNKIFLDINGENILKLIKDEYDKYSPELSISIKKYPDIDKNIYKILYIIIKNTEYNI